MITRKQWNRKTTLKQYLSVFDGVRKQIVLPDIFKITFFCEMGLCFMVIELFKVKT